MRRATAASALLAITLGGALSACDKKKSNDDATVSANVSAGATVAPEELRTSAAAVAAGLTQIISISADVAAKAAIDKSAAEAAADSIEGVWSKIEGTVKANDSNAYLAFEDAFAQLKIAAQAGDATKAASASATVGATASAYLKKYQG